MTEQQFAALFGVLCQIRDALVGAMEQELPQDPDAPCLHPDEARVDFGLTNGRPHWICRVCRFDSSTAK